MVALPYAQVEIMSSRHSGLKIKINLYFFSSKAKKAQAAEAAEALKPPGLKGLRLT